MERLGQKAVARALGNANTSFDRMKNKAAKLAEQNAAEADAAASAAMPAISSSSLRASTAVPSSAVLEANAEKAKGLITPPTKIGGGEGKVEEHLASIDKAVNNLSSSQLAKDEAAAAAEEAAKKKHSILGFF